MKFTKNNIILFFFNLIGYLIIIFTFSLNEKIKDIIFLVGFTTIMISSLLSLFKINLEKFKYFIWINLIVFPITYLYDNYIYDKNNFLSHVILILIIITFFGVKFFKKQKSKTK